MLVRNLRPEQGNDQIFCHTTSGGFLPARRMFQLPLIPDQGEDFFNFEVDNVFGSFFAIFLFR